MVVNLGILALAIARVLLLTGVGPGLALAYIIERHYAQTGHLFMVSRGQRRGSRRPEALLLVMRPQSRRAARAMRLPEVSAK